MPDGKSGPQIIEMLTKRATALGAVASGSFMVDCETYTSVAPLGKSRSSLLSKQQLCDGASTNVLADLSAALVFSETTKCFLFRCKMAPL